MKIKFNEYNIIYNKIKYKILIPDKTEIMTLYNYDSSQDPVCCDGTRFDFKVLKYASCILGFNPNIIFYFPIKNNNIHKRNDTLDMVWYSNKVNLKLSDWKYIKQKIKKYNKIEKYVLNYNEERTMKYFSDNLKKNDPYYIKGDNCPDHRLLHNTLFCRYLREDYQSICIDLIEYLKTDLEKNFRDSNKKYKFLTCTSNIWIGSPVFFSKRRRGAVIETGFYDKTIVRQLHKG